MASTLGETRNLSQCRPVIGFSLTNSSMVEPTAKLNGGAGRGNRANRAAARTQAYASSLLPLLAHCYKPVARDCLPNHCRRAGAATANYRSLCIYENFCSPPFLEEILRASLSKVVAKPSVTNETRVSVSYCETTGRLDCTARQRCNAVRSTTLLANQVAQKPSRSVFLL